MSHWNRKINAMEKEDQERLIKIEVGVNYLREKWDDEFVPVAKEVSRHKTLWAIYHRDKKWVFGILAALGATLIAGMDGIWEWFKHK